MTSAVNSSRERSLADIGTSNLVAVEPGAIREDTPPGEQIFGTTAIVPRHVRRAGRNTVDPTSKNYQWGDLTSASFEAKDRGARTAILLDADTVLPKARASTW